MFLNLLDGYIQHSLPESGSFSTNPNLRKKVDNQGNFLPFYGNTIVFMLDAWTKERLAQIQDALYCAAGQMLAQKLDTSTFHMTLHDLVNGSILDGPLMLRMGDAEFRAKSFVEKWRHEQPIKMRGTWLFNMVNTSIVLGLAPADDDSGHRLSHMYETLETVVPLGYALTPHITMAYFRPGVYDWPEISLLAAALHPVEVDVELPMENLVYQTFSDMNHYENR